MRKVLMIIGLLLFFAGGVATGYGIFCIQASNGGQAGNPDRPSNPKASGLYKDDDVAAMRGKLAQLPLPISKEEAFQILGIDESRIERPTFSASDGLGGHQAQFAWRLSPTYGIAMHSDWGPDFGPRPPANKEFTRILIGKGKQAGSKSFVIDPADKEISETSVPSVGKGWRLEYWQYPKVAKKGPSLTYFDGILGGFACSTADDFDKVLDFYYDRCGMPKGTLSKSEGKSGPVSEATMFHVLEKTFLETAVQVRSLHLFKLVEMNGQKSAGYSVSVTIIRGQGEKQTLIFVNLW